MSDEKKDSDGGCCLISALAIILIVLALCSGIKFFWNFLWN